MEEILLSSKTTFCVDVDDPPNFFSESESWSAAWENISAGWVHGDGETGGGGGGEEGEGGEKE